MKAIRYIILVGINVALFNLSSALHSNLESLSILSGDVYNNVVDELSDHVENKYSEEGGYADQYKTIHNLNESDLQNANSFLDESNSDKVSSDNDSYQNAAVGSGRPSEVLPEVAALENLSAVYTKLIELSSVDSANSYDMMYDKQKINKQQPHKEKQKEKAYIRIKSAKNLNNRESIQIKKFQTQDVKKKNMNFLESAKEDLLSSDLIGANYVLENAAENAFEDNVKINSKEKSSEVVENPRAKSGKLVHKKNKNKSNKRKSAKHMAFVEKSKKHRDSSHSKKEKKKQTHHKNNSKSNDTRKHEDTVNKKHAQHKTEGHTDKSNKLAKTGYHLQTDSESEDKEENDEETKQGTSRKPFDEHSPKNENHKAAKQLDNETNKRTHMSSTNADDANDDDNDDDADDDESDDDDDESEDDDDESEDDDDDDDDDGSDENGEGNENLMLKHEIDTIKNNSKVYKLNLFNCSFINDWDFAHQYVEEKGLLVKLSGYVFQNMQDTDAMPTSNTGDWKLKGACDFTKYVCGALNFMPNQYNKGDRVIFENRLYEALMNTELSPQDDGSSWVDKTKDCEEKLMDN